MNDKQNKNVENISKVKEKSPNANKNPQNKNVQSETAVSKESVKDLEILSKQMSQTKKNYSNRDVATESIQNDIKKSFKMLGSINAETRKEGVKSLKNIRSEIDKLNDSMLKDKAHYNKVIDEALENVLSSTNEISVLSEEMQKKFLAQLPTLKGLKDTFLNSFSPMIPFFINIYSEFKEFRKKNKEMAESIKEEAKQVAKQLKNQEDEKKSKKQKEKREEDLLEENKNQSNKLSDIDNTLKNSKNDVDSDSELISELKIHTNLLEKISGVEKIELKKDTKEENKNTKDNRLQKKLTQKQVNLSNDINKISLGVANEQLEKISGVESNTSKLLDIIEKQYKETEQNSLQSLKEENKHQLLSPNLLPKESEKESSGNNSLLENVVTLLGLKKLKGLTKGITKILGGVLGIVGIGKGASQLADGIEIANDALSAPKLSKIMKIGKLSSKFLGRLSIAGTVLFAMFDFVDGFSNASKILGKEDVDIRDRISAGAASIVGGFVGIIDTVGEALGYDTTIGGKKIGEWTTEIFAKYWSALSHPIDTTMKMLDWVEKQWKESNILGKGEWLLNKVSEMFTFIKDIFISFIKDQIKNVTSILPDWLVPDSLEKWVEPAKQQSGEIQQPDKVDNNTGWINETSKWVAEKANDVSNLTDKVMNIVSPTNNNVNNVTNVQTPTINTRNDDISFAIRLG